MNMITAPTTITITIPQSYYNTSHNSSSLPRNNIISSNKYFSINTKRSRLSLWSGVGFCKKMASSTKTKAAVDNTTITSSAVIISPKWAQKTVTIAPQPRGCHLITPMILKEIGKDLSQFDCGLAHFFLQHTSASLTINENYDSDVRHDTETFLNRIVPEGSSAPWQHTLEGPDDMPAHIKSSMFGCSLTIPISKGRLNMGTWQGIWLCEHRDLATPRKVIVTLNGI